MGLCTKPQLDAIKIYKTQCLSIKITGHKDPEPALADFHTPIKNVWNISVGEI